MSSPHPTTIKTYASRIRQHPNRTAKRVLQIMERKQSNLCVSVDVTTCAEVLSIVRAVGKSVCMVKRVKTHCDIIEDFTLAFAHELVELGKDLDFTIFEDRKFADIGNTVTLQYSSGVHRISSWADLTNAHPLPGPGIIQGLSSIGQPLGRGLLLLAEMSSSRNLATGGYTREAVGMARRAGRGFVVGFIAMSRVDSDNHGVGDEDEDEDWLIMTPGVGLASDGDKLGQQYRTPRQVIYESGCDVIIVGRGIYGVQGDQAIRDEAERYRVEGWKAYEERLKR